MKLIEPGATIGVLGSGQLGRMFAIAARRMGYRVHTLSPDRDTPTGQVADLEVEAAYDDIDAVHRFSQGVDVVTFEFENVPAAAVDACVQNVPVHPGGHVLHTTQNRLREKTFLSKHGFPVAPFAPIHTLADLQTGADRLGLPAILKTAGFGYDGKGQVRINEASDLETAFDSLNGAEGVLEEFIDFDSEVSVVAARGANGSFAHYGVVSNQHRHHILDLTIAPAEISPAIADEAVEIARGVLEELEVIGVLCVEFFLTREGTLIVNELAPRPHNSGHWTFDACVTSQFEQQLRAVCHLPLGSTEQLRPAAMINLLGDLWEQGEPNWAAACALPGVKLHLYGKTEARAGRKMGHLTAMAHSPAEAARQAYAAREALLKRS